MQRITQGAQASAGGAEQNSTNELTEEESRVMLDLKQNVMTASADWVTQMDQILSHFIQGILNTHAIPAEVKHSI